MINNKFILAGLLVLLSLSCSTTKDNPNSESTNQESLIKQELKWQNRARTYWIHLPPKEKLNGPVPLLFHLHGGGGTGKATPWLIFNRFNELADDHGFIVVYPDGLNKAWNDGRIENLKPQNKDVDDVGFIVEIIKRMKAEYAIDSDKIFTAGMSNGGFMTSRLLCDRADLFRGGAILTASISEQYKPECHPSRPVAVLVMNGTTDPIVPFDGGHVRLPNNPASRGKILSHEDYLTFWSHINGCSTEGPSRNLPNIARLDGTTVSVSSFNNCTNNGALISYIIKGGGHTWPGGRQYLGRRTIGNTSRDINACDEIWDFFSSLE